MVAKGNSMEIKPFTVRIENEMRKKLKFLSIKYDKSLNHLISQAIREFLIKHNLKEK